MYDLIALIHVKTYTSMQSYYYQIVQRAKYSIRYHIEYPMTICPYAI